MAYNGYNGYGDDAMEGVESSGPKVTVREVSHVSSSSLRMASDNIRSNKIALILSSNHVHSV